MCTQQTVVSVCAHRRQLMLYMHTSARWFCLCTQLTINAEFAHNRKLILYVHTQHMQQIAHFFAFVPRQLDAWLSRSVWLLVYIIVSQAIIVSLLQRSENFSSLDIEPSIKSTQPLCKRTLALAAVAFCPTYISIPCPDN